MCAVISLRKAKTSACGGRLLLRQKSAKPFAPDARRRCAPMPCAAGIARAGPNSRIHALEHADLCPAQCGAARRALKAQGKQQPAWIRFDLPYGFAAVEKQHRALDRFAAWLGVASQRIDGQKRTGFDLPRLEGCRASQPDRRASADCSRATDGPSSARRLSGATRREPRSGSRSAQMVLVTFAVTKVTRRRRKLLILVAR